MIIRKSTDQVSSRNELGTEYTQVSISYQASGINRFWSGVSLLSPLRPIPRNGNPLLKFLGTYWRALSPAPYPTSSVGNRPAENALPNLPATALVPGS